MKSVRVIILFLLWAISVVSVSGQHADNKPLFSFGLIADVQYADVDSWGKRDYRGSLERLERAVEILNSHHLSFTTHCGDLIDRYYDSFDRPLGILKGSRAPIHYVIGNHEFSVPDSLKESVRKRLNNPKGYYSFVVDSYQFILVDAMDVSVHASVKGSKQYLTALEWQQSLKERSANNAYDWNGGIGGKQLKWLERKLRWGERKGYHTILFSHHPLLPENGLQLWNNQEVISLLNRHPSVIAFISGHHHEGGYVQQGGIHYVTLKGLVEATSDTACAIAEVYRDKIIIRGSGDQPDYTLEYR